MPIILQFWDMELKAELWDLTNRKRKGKTEEGYEHIKLFDFCSKLERLYVPAKNFSIG
jgi:hypothetical protein